MFSNPKSTMLAPSFPLFLLLTIASLVLASAASFDDSFDDDFSPIMRLEALQKRRGRELFGKRSGMDRQSRRTRELFGKRADPTMLASEIGDQGVAAPMEPASPVAELFELIRKRAVSEGENDDGLDRILSLLGNHQRARRARGVQRELFGRR